MTVPNLFVLGAPKCGTTALAAWLSDHPNVYFSPVKEPNHFYSPYGPPMSRDEYLRLFVGVRPFHHIVAEGSVWYLSSPDALEGIRAASPNAKVVVCVRNPVEMAFSLHQQKVLVGHEQEVNFSRAWALNGERAAGRFVRVSGISGGDPRHMDYLGACRLGSQLIRAKRLFGDSLHTVVLDDIVASPRETWLALLKFLDLPDDGRSAFDVVNPAKRVRFPWLGRGLGALARGRSLLGIRRPTHLLARLYAANLRAEKARMLPSERRMLVSAFLEEVRMLESELGRSFASWITS